MVEFETIESRDIKFGNNNFIEVSIKKAVTDEGENSFFSLSRGFFTPENEKRYKKNFAIPNDGSTCEEVLSALQEVMQSAPEQAAPEDQASEEAESESQESEEEQAE